MPAENRGAIVDSGEDRFDQFFTLSPDLHCVISLEGYFIELDPAWEKILGFSPMEMKAEPFIEYIHPDDRERMHREVQGMIAGEESRSFVKRILCKDGSFRWFSWTATLAVDEGRIYAIARDVTDLRQQEDSLRQALAQRRELLSRLLSVREEERTQLARVVHDEMGQVLTGLKMDLAWLQNHLDPEQDLLLAKTQVMSRLIDTTIQAVRQISIELRPPILDDLGLVAAIEWQLQDLQKRTSLHCELISSREEIALDVDGRTTVFRIFQEILTNVSRHAHASQIKVALRETGDYLLLRVHDNGRGISHDEIHSTKSVGLLGMRERAQLRGGDMHIKGTAGDGTTVTVRLPLNNGQSAGRDQGIDWDETS